MEGERGSFSIGEPDGVSRTRPRKAKQDRLQKGNELNAAGAVSVIREDFEDEIFDGRIQGWHVRAGEYSVRGSKGNGYTVMVRDARDRGAECNCEDARRLRRRGDRESCKHVHAVRAHIRATDRRVRLECDVREYELVLANPERRGGLKLSFFRERLQKLRRELAELGGATEAASYEEAARPKSTPEEIDAREQKALF